MQQKHLQFQASRWHPQIKLLLCLLCWSILSHKLGLQSIEQLSVPFSVDIHHSTYFRCKHFIQVSNCRVFVITERVTWLKTNLQICETMKKEAQNGGGTLPSQIYCYLFFIAVSEQTDVTSKGSVVQREHGNRRPQYRFRLDFENSASYFKANAGGFKDGGTNSNAFLFIKKNTWSSCGRHYGECFC